MPVQIQFRRGTASEWTSANPTLSAGEVGFETDTNKFKLGTGSTAWTSLSYISPITASSTDTLTNKTLTSPVISSITNTGTITLPSSTDTLVGRATTDTLTNKTLTSPALTTPTISTATTNGDLLYGTGSGALTRLGIGSTAQVLTVSGGVPSWATPAGGGGKVLQVVSAVITTATTIATTTMTDTGITLSITPTLNTSKVLVMINGIVRTSRTINQYALGSNIVRGSTDILIQGYDSYQAEIISSTGVNFTNKLTYIYLDSPATTSSTTYKLQSNLTQTGNSNTSTWQNNSYPSTITLLEIGA